MNIKNLVALDYAMSVISEIYKHTFNSELKYSLVFQQGSDIFMGKLVDFNNIGPEINVLDYDLKDMVKTFTIDDTDYHNDVSFAKIRHQLFRHFDTMRQTRMNKTLISNPNLLLEFLLNFIKDYEIEDIYVPNSFREYSSLSNQVKLPFKLITTDEFDVVSLCLQN